MRWEKMLAKLPEDLSLRELKTLVCPLLAANEAEQDLVYQIYDDCLATVETIHSRETKTSKKSWWKQALLLVSVLFVVYAAYRYFVPNITPKATLSEEIESSYLQLSPKETKKVCIKSNKLGNRPKMVKANLLNTAKINTELGQYKLEAVCLEYMAMDTVGADTFQVQLTDINGKNWQTTYYVNIRSIPLDTIIRQVLQKKARPVSAPLFATKDLPYPNDIRDLTIPPLTALEKFYQENAKLIKFLLIALFTALLAKILLARDEKRKKLIAEPKKKKRVLPLLGLPKALLATIKSGEVFFRLLNKFRGRTPDEFYRLHIPKTIAHTIKNAGMVQFKYALQSRPSEYLLLIDKTSEELHLGHLYDLVYEYFQENEVHFERFYWEAKLGLWFNEKNEAGLSLEALQHQYYQSKLLFLTANPLISTAFSSISKEWVANFKHWPTSNILLPVSYYETLSAANKKHASYSVIPATIEGLHFILTNEIGENLAKSKGELFIRQLSNYKKAIIPPLKQNYGESVVLWMAATAIYPSIHWNLTLYIGQIIANYKKDLGLLSIEHLFEIANLPWFITGEIPLAIRTELIQFLQGEHRELYENLITEINSLFANTDALKDSKSIQQKSAIIGMEAMTNIAQEKAATKSASTYDINPQNSFPIIQKLTQKQNLLDYIIPNEWRQYLKKLGFPNLGMQDFWKDVLFLMLPLWLLFSGFVWNLPETWDNCEGEIIPYSYEGELLSLCIDSPQDKVLLQEYYARDAIKVGNAKAVDSLANLVRKGKDKGIFEAILSRDESDVEPLRQAEKAFFGNIGTTYYNKGVMLYEERSTQAADAETKAANRDEVCYNFDRAIKFDSLDLTLQKAVRWCVKNQIKSVTLQGQVLDGDTQQPVRNAKITYLGKSIATNSRGQFVFSLNQKSIKQEKTSISITKIAYQSRIDSFALQQIDRETYAFTTPIYLSPIPKPKVNYQLKGTIVDIATQKKVVGLVDIFVNGQLEAVGENGQFAFELTNEAVKSDQISIKFAKVDYEPLTQVLNFNKHTEITLNVTLIALPQEIVGVSSAPKVDAAAGIGEVIDSLDYLLTTIMETREAFVPFDFETPIPKMELIEGDTFVMGDVLRDRINNNEPTHTVAINSYYLGNYEVTYEEIDRFTRAKKESLINDKGWGRGQQPVIGINWYQAIEYCNWLSEEHGYEPVYTIDKTIIDEDNLNEADTLKWVVVSNWIANGYRLPTEAEWEFAARQRGQQIRFGNGLNQANTELINFKGSLNPKELYEIEGIDRAQALPIGSFSPNANDLYDLSGNVSEWCWDWRVDYPNTGLTLNPKGGETGTLKVVRGGAYDLPVVAARTTARQGKVPQLNEGIGFRLCRGVE